MPLAVYYILCVADGLITGVLLGAADSKESRALVFTIGVLAYVVATVVYSATN